MSFTCLIKATVELNESSLNFKLLCAALYYRSILQAKEPIVKSNGKYAPIIKHKPCISSLCKFLFEKQRKCAIIGLLPTVSSWVLIRLVAKYDAAFLKKLKKYY